MNIKPLFIRLMIAVTFLGSDLGSISAKAPSARPVTRASSKAQPVKKVLIKQTILTVTCNVRGATVTQDGIILGNAGNAFEVDPGIQVISVSAPGYQPQRIKTLVKVNARNTVNVTLIKAQAPKRQSPGARPTVAGRKQALPQRRSAAGAPGKQPLKKGQNLFGDDFAGTESGPAASFSAPRSPTPRAPQPSRPSQPSQLRPAAPRQQPRQQQAPSYQPGYGPGSNPAPQQGYAQPGYQQPYQQPYQQAPAYPPSYPNYPNYQGAPGYNPGYAPGYNPGYNPGYAPGYNPGYAPGFSPPMYQAPSPYYYYPQQQPPPAMAAPVAPPMDTMAPPSVAESPLPSVAEAPSQSGPPSTEELFPRVAATKKASAGSRNPVIKFLPFGAGQYQNRNYLLGGAFTAAQGGALALYFINSSNAASAKINYNKYITARDSTSPASAEFEYNEAEANKQKTFAKSSDQNATLGLLAFGAVWVTSTIEASINAPSSKSKKKSRGRRRGMAFETGLGEDGLEAQISYNF